MRPPPALPFFSPGMTRLQGDGVCYHPVWDTTLDPTCSHQAIISRLLSAHVIPFEVFHPSVILFFSLKSVLLIQDSWCLNLDKDGWLSSDRQTPLYFPQESPCSSLLQLSSLGNKSHLQSKEILNKVKSSSAWFTRQTEMLSRRGNFILGEKPRLDLSCFSLPFLKIKWSFQNMNTHTLM